MAISFVCRISNILTVYFPINFEIKIYKKDRTAKCIFCRINISNHISEVKSEDVFLVMTCVERTLNFRIAPPGRTIADKKLD